MSLTVRSTMLNRKPDTHAIVELCSSDTSSALRFLANFRARPALDLRIWPPSADSLFCGTHSTRSSSSAVNPSCTRYSEFSAMIENRSTAEPSEWASWRIRLVRSMSFCPCAVVVCGQTPNTS